MNKFLILLVTALTSIGFAAATAPVAETTDITVEGMHCSGCKKMISKKVCDDKDLAAKFESCKVELVDAKKQIGKISVTMKKDQTLDLAAVETAVKAAGEDYKVVKPAAQK